LFYYFLKRELKESYLGNITGLSWVFVQPIITLFIYWFVFDKIFQSRIPADINDYGFIVYVAIGFWPWIAFSDSLISSINAITNKEELIGKVKIDLRIIVLAVISAKYILHVAGYIAIILVLLVFYPNLLSFSLLLIFLPMLQLFVLAVALGLMLSALQVFIRDTFQIVSTIISLLFFLTPILYSESIIPEQFKTYIQFNPLYTPITFIHNTVFKGNDLPWFNLLVLTAVTLIILYYANKLFKKLSPYFEDFK